MSQTFTSDKKIYKQGDIIAMQGDNYRQITVLGGGTAELLYCADRNDGMSQSELLGASRRIGMTAGKEFVGVTNLINEEPQTVTVRALTDCQAMTVTVPQTTNEIVDFLRMNAGLALNVLNGVRDIVQKSMNNMKKYARMASDMQKVSDNLMLLYSHINKKDTPLMKHFRAAGGEIDSSVAPTFLLEDFSEQLGTNYNVLSFDPVERYDFNRLDFYNNLIKSKPEAFSALFFANPKIYTYIYKELAAIIDEINIETAKCSKQIDQAFTSFFDDEQSAFNRISECGDKLGKIGGPALCNGIVSLCRNMEKNYTQLIGIEHISPTDKYAKLIKNAASVPTEETAQTAATSNGAFKKKLKGSVQKILGFSTLSKEKKDSVAKAIKNLKNINYQDPTAKDSRLIIRKMQEEFFALYYNILLKVFEKDLIDSLPLEISLFLYFGFADETLITEEQAEFLVNSVGILRKPYNGKIKLITLVDYLRLIYDGTEQPSMSETGEIFSKVVKRTFSKNEKVIEDTPAGRLDFEISNMVKSAMRITSDNLRAYVPVLTEHSFKGAPNRIFMQPKRMEVITDKINKLDYTLFFRETTWKVPGKSELIKKEVTPYMILVPSSGVRVQMWQEMINNMRSTRGRLVLPVLFNGDIEKATIKAFAHFRWELNKVIAGANWMDPTEGGLVGSYYDYSQYYDKNYKELSLEAKELIKIQFQRIKIDRDRFAADYLLWLQNESQGIPKLNKVVRGMFYKYVPFPKETRTYLAKLPLFTEFDTKFNNIRNRDYKSLESRYHKYLEDGKLPHDLQAYLDMMRG